MKIRNFLNAQMLIVLCVACSVEPIDNIDPAAPPETAVADFTINASVESAATKAALGDDNTIVWQEGDKIGMVSVLSGTVAESLELVSGEGTTSGIFSGHLSDYTVDRLPVYPFRDNRFNNYEDGEAVISWSAATSSGFKANIQTATPGGFDPESCLMAGQLGNDNKVEFKNLCAYIKFTTSFDFTSLTITCADDDECLTSDMVQFSFDENGKPSGILPYSYSYDTDHVPFNYVTLTGNGGAEIEAGTYLVAVLPSVIENGFTFTFTADGVNYRKSTFKSVTLTRNKILNFGTFSLSGLTPDKSFEGAGTESNPYIIDGLDKLEWLADWYSSATTFETFKGKCFKQTEDIDCLGKTICIGGYTAYTYDRISENRSYPFNAHYDGGGHTISNFYMEAQGSPRPDNNSPLVFGIGLFGNVSGAEIKNLKIAPAVESDGSVVYTSHYQDYPESWWDMASEYVGFLIGCSQNATISDCELEQGTYSLSQKADTRRFGVGSLVGFAYGPLTMTDCVNRSNLSCYSASVSGQVTAGGLIGYVEGNTDMDLKIDRCRNLGTVSAENAKDVAYAGGIVGSIVEAGYNVTPMISNCVNEKLISATSVNGDDAYSGGIVGNFHTDGGSQDPYVHNCLNKGNIYAKGNDASCGGILGYCYDSDTEIAVCLNTGYITGDNDPHNGAICGMGSDIGFLEFDYTGAECVGCYWLEKKDSKDDYSVTPDMLVSYNWNQKHNFFFKSLSCDYPNNRIGVSKWMNEDNSDWTTAEWLAKACKWTGVTRYNDDCTAIVENTLDIDFTQNF